MFRTKSNNQKSNQNQKMLSRQCHIAADKLLQLLDDDFDE